LRSPHIEEIGMQRSSDVWLCRRPTLEFRIEHEVDGAFVSKNIARNVEGAAIGQLQNCVTRTSAPAAVAAIRRCVFLTQDSDTNQSARYRSAASARSSRAILVSTAW
jgi:hypothetical protein